LFREFFTGWAELRMDIERLVDLGGDRVLGLVTFRGVGKESGLPVEFELAHLIQLRNGRIVRNDAFPSWEEGLRAAGLADGA
jgi:ketosteroid isomerase-like protein